MYKKITQPLWVFKFFTQPLIEIQDFKAAFVNLTRSDCFICFCHCVFHVYVINCVRLFAIITHCSMFSYSNWSFFSPNLFSKRFQSQLPTQFFVSAPLSGARPPNDLYTIIVLAILRCDARFFQPSISEVAERRALFMYSCSVFVHFF